MASDSVVALVQQIMDTSAEKAGPMQKGIISNPQWKADAAGFLAKWESTHMAVVTTVGPSGQPHSAVVESVKFGDDGNLTSLMYANSVRRQDLQKNARISVVKVGTDGSAMTIYGKAREIPDSLKDSFGGQTVTVDITPSRIFGIIPSGHPERSS